MNRRKGWQLARLALLLALAGCATPGTRTVRPPGGWGRFAGVIRTEWGQGGRKMRLLEDTHYIGPDGRDWLAAKGSDIDGASIPQAFWCTVGGPFEDSYRDASVFHDVACDQKTSRWEDVHYMFYTAMRCSGVSDQKAKIMYAAVYRFGPRWGETAAPAAADGPEMRVRAFSASVVGAVTTRQPSDAEAEEIAAWVRANNPRLEEIEKTKTIPGRSGPAPPARAGISR